MLHNRIIILALSAAIVSTMIMGCQQNNVNSAPAQVDTTPVSENSSVREDTKRIDLYLTAMKQAHRAILSL